MQETAVLKEGNRKKAGVRIQNTGVQKKARVKMKKDRHQGIKAVRQSEQGVSLMELLTVLAIIVTLVAMGIAEFGRMDNRAVRNGAIVSSKGLAMAMKMYKQEKGTYTCALDDLMPYINLTNLRNSFLTVAVETDTCASFTSLTYLRLSAFVKGVEPPYIVKYHVYPNQEPDCSADNWATNYPCTEKW